MESKLAPLSPPLFSTKADCPTRGYSKHSKKSQTNLIIGIDYGTSYTGVAYTLFRGARVADPIVDVVADWPNRNTYLRSIEKVSSDIAYDADGQPHCGFDVPDGLKRLRWVKLLLESDSHGQKLQAAAEVQETKKILAELGKTPTQAAADYLSWLWETSKAKICEIERNKALFAVASVTVVMTVPAMWSDMARDNTLCAVELAGISGKDRILKFLNEPEAAAISELRNRVSKGQIGEGECVIICDAGGGTVDVVSYEVKSTDPLTLNQKVVAQGDLCGSVYIDHEFFRQLRGLLRDDEVKLSEEAMSDIAERFEYVIKPSFEEFSTKEYFISVPGLHDDSQRNIKNGKMRLDNAILKTAFENVMPQILTLIDDQYVELRDTGCIEKLKGILMVGGLGESKFLYSRVCQNYPEEDGIIVWQSDRSWTSVVKGAVRCEYMALGNINLINTRLSRWNYGISFNEPFDETKHSPKDKYFCPYGKIDKARNQVTWLVKKGQEIVPESDPEVHEFGTILKEADFMSDGTCTLEIILVRSDVVDAPEYRTADVNEFVSIMCKLEKSILEDPRLTKLDVDPPAWRLRLVVELKMNPAMLSFRCLFSGKEIGTTTVSYRGDVASATLHATVPGTEHRSQSSPLNPRASKLLVPGSEENHHIDHCHLSSSKSAGPSITSRTLPPGPNFPPTPPSSSPKPLGHHRTASDSWSIYRQHYPVGGLDGDPPAERFYVDPGRLFYQNSLNTKKSFTSRFLKESSSSEGLRTRVTSRGVETRNGLI